MNRLLPLLALVVLSSTASAAPGFFAQLGGGPAFATFYPVDEGGTVSEHLATGGSQLAIGVGHGWELGWLRLDLGLQLQHTHLSVAGRYDAEHHDDAFRAGYGYLAPELTLRASTRTGARVNPYLGLSLGTAFFLSDRQGQPLRTELIPVYGTFEGGLLFQLTDAFALSAGLAFVPPVEKLAVFAPQLGLRAAL